MRSRIALSVDIFACVRVSEQINVCYACRFVQYIMNELEINVEALAVNGMLALHRQMQVEVCK